MYMAIETYIILNLIFVIPFALTLLTVCMKNALFFTPNELYRRTKMNIIGCYICSFVIVIIFPIYCIPASIIWIIYYLFHIGRKEDKNEY